MSSNERPKFVLTLQPLPGVADPIRTLRRALKRLLRDHGLRCVSAREEANPQPMENNDGTRNTQDRR
jgi:hypothetical protein